MSGIEAAGIALGVFPILYEGAKKLRETFNDVGTWWRFENEFEDFVLAIEKEHIAFSQNLEILLAPLDIKESERQQLQNDPSSMLWYEPRIQSELKQRIQDRYYMFYMRQLQELKNAVEKLHKLLPINQVLPIQ
jgi:hypothetical protein